MRATCGAHILDYIAQKRVIKAHNMMILPTTHLEKADKTAYKS